MNDKKTAHHDIQMVALNFELMSREVHNFDKAIHKKRNNSHEDNVYELLTILSQHVTLLTHKLGNALLKEAAELEDPNTITIARKSADNSEANYE